MNQSDFIQTISEIRPSSTFLSLTDYCNANQEVADYSIVFHVSYETLLNKSIEQLTQYSPVDSIEEEAKVSLLSSYQASLKKIQESSIEETQDGYRHFQDGEGNWIKGVKIHEDSGTLHLYGKVVHKVVKKGSAKKETKSSNLTLAKQRLTMDLPISKWRQFKLSPNQVGKICVENLKLNAPDD